MLGLIFRKAQNKIQDPAKLRQLIVEPIGKEDRLSRSADVRGDAGQCFTPRPLIQAIVDCIQPALGEVMVTNPPFGKKSSMTVVNEGGDTDRDA